MLRFPLAALALLALALPLRGEIVASFTEGAPTDSFTFHNTGSCPLTGGLLTLDLAPSAGRLIFDVTGTGAGVQVFQPFTLTAGQNALTGLPVVRDGESALSFELTTLAPNGRISFTIDVDDTLGAREITVTGSEIAGATLSYSGMGLSESAAFSEAARAALPVSGCTS